MGSNNTSICKESSLRFHCRLRNVLISANDSALPMISCQSWIYMQLLQALPGPSPALQLLHDTTYQRAQIKHCMSSKFLRTVGPWCTTVYLIFGQIWYLEFTVSPDVRPCKKFMGKNYVQGGSECLDSC